jgi:hypothetical protein
MLSLVRSHVPIKACLEKSTDVTLSCSETQYCSMPVSRADTHFPLQIATKTRGARRKKAVAKTVARDVARNGGCTVLSVWH